VTIEAEGLTAGETIIIGPLGMNNPVLDVRMDSGLLGTLTSSIIAVPARQGFPFLLSFLPYAQYPFTGWQASFSDGTLYVWEIGDDEKVFNGVRWRPMNASGTEMAVTIENLPEGFDPGQDTITIMPRSEPDIQL